MFIKLSKMQGSSVRARNAKYVIILNPLDKCLQLFMEITPLSQRRIAGNSVSSLSKLRNIVMYSTVVDAFQISSIYCKMLCIYTAAVQK